MIVDYLRYRDKETLITYMLFINIERWRQPNRSLAEQDT